MVRSGALALTMMFAACGGDGSGASSAVTTPGAAADGAPPPPSPAGCQPSTEQSLVAEGLKFDRSCIAVPAHQTTSLTLTNNDPGESHEVAIYRWESCFARAARAGDVTTCADPSEGLRFKGDILKSGSTTYHILGLRPGQYAFICLVHPTMHGVFNVG
ncbi:MAG: Cupredoxin-like domain [Actinomycetota bacterium]|nr:Cupredoxin-like domain [Actinomycetota bacterium]